MKANQIKNLTLSQINNGVEHLELSGVGMWYEYSEGQKTSTVLGTMYKVIAHFNGYERLNVKVSGKPIVEAEQIEESLRAQKKVYITFEGFSGSLYQNNQGELALTARADKASILKEKKGE